MPSFPISPSDPSSSDLAGTLRVLADEQSLAIIFRLHVGQCTLPVLAEAIGTPEDRLAERLAELCEVGLVRVNPDPTDTNTTLYGLDPAGFHELNRAWKVVARRPQAGAVPSPLADRVAALRALPLFAQLDDADLTALASRMHSRAYAPGEILFLEGNECPGLYIVEAGLVKIFKQGLGGPGGVREQTLRLMGPGDSFNEVPVFDSGPNPASAQALEHSQVLLLPKDAVRQMLRMNPAFAETIVAVFAGRLRHMVAMVEDLSFRHVAGRVAKILLQSVHPDEGVGAGAGRRTRLTQQEMAEMAGTAREVVARALRDLERQGAIRLDRGRITILDPKKLETLT